MQKTALLGVLLLLIASCASIPSGQPDPRDPWERFNRSAFKFNDALDRAVARPVAKAYVKVTPRFIRTG
ncbi:MAG: MlaA family lipoprotein, partial [Blastocatellia bacterium]